MLFTPRASFVGMTPGQQHKAHAQKVPGFPSMSCFHALEILNFVKLILMGQGSIKMSTAISCHPVCI